MPDSNPSKKINIWHRIWSVYFLFWHRLKNPTTLRKISSRAKLPVMLSAKSIHGYELEVFCHTVRYRFYYSAWWARPKVFTMFEIYSRVSNDAPPSLKKVCQITVCLPTLLSPYVEDGAQTRAAVEAYIDLILYELRNNRSFAVTEKYEQQ